MATDTTEVEQCCGRVESLRVTSSNAMTQEQLLEQLQKQQEAMTRLQARAHAQQAQSNMLTTSLMTKLRRKDHQLNALQLQNEENLSAVVSHLLRLEGHMQREYKDVAELLHERDDVIRRQKAAIEDLSAKYERLMKAWKESHGYTAENGISGQPSNQVVMQNGKVSIQDHGNKVVLRGNKDKNVDKPAHKVRFSTMKERLRRHKSSLELYHSEPLEPLVEGSLRYFGSQENLVGPELRSGRHRIDLESRREKSWSLGEYSHPGLREVDEGLDESPDSCFSDDLNVSDVSQSDSGIISMSSLHNGKNHDAAQHGFHELSKSRSVPHALPTVTENEGIPANLKERPLSLPSVELLAGDAPTSAKVSMSPNVTPSNPPPPPPPVSTPPAQSESNPFKSFKNVFKRRGSKKKRSVSLGQSTNKQYHEALEQHFKKYDLS